MRDSAGSKAGIKRYQLRSFLRLRVVKRYAVAAAHGGKGFARECIRAAEQAVIARPRFFVNLTDTAAGQNIVELIEQNVLPQGFDVFGRVCCIAAKGGCGRPQLERAQRLLAPAVAGLDGALGGICAAVALEIQLAAVHGQTELLAPCDKVRRRFVVHFRRALNIFLSADLLQFIPGGAAAAVAVAEGQQEFAGAILDHAVAPALVEGLRVDKGFIAHMQIAGDFAAIHALPAEGVVGELLCVVVRPEDFLRSQALKTEALDNLRQRSAVAKGIRQPRNAALGAELFFEIARAVKELADQRFAAGKVGIRLNPHRAVGDPAPAADGGLDVFKKLRVARAAHFIQHALALQEKRFGILLKQAQLLGEGALGLALGFLRRPQPCNVEVRIAHGGHRRGERAVFRFHYRAQPFAGFPVCGAAGSKRLFHVEAVQHIAKDIADLFAQEGGFGLRVVDVKEHLAVKPELIGLLVPQAERVFAHDGGRQRLHAHAFIGKYRTCCAAAAGLFGQGRAAVHLAGEGKAFAALRAAGKRLVDHIVMRNGNPFCAARAERAPVDKERAFSAGVKVHDDALAARGFRQRDVRKQPCISPRRCEESAFGHRLSGVFCGLFEGQRLLCAEAAEGDVAERMVKVALQGFEHKLQLFALLDIHKYLPVSSVSCGKSPCRCSGRCKDGELRIQGIAERGNYSSRISASC